MKVLTVSIADSASENQHVNQAEFNAPSNLLRFSPMDVCTTETIVFAVNGQQVSLKNIDLPPYLMEDKPRLLAFLRANRDLVAFAEEAYSRILLQFGDSARASLRIDEASDYPGGASLEIAVHTEREPGEVLAALKRLYDDWWLDTMAQIGDKVTLTVEFDEL